MNYSLILIVAMAILATGLVAAPVTTVKQIDVNRYLGRWYQVAYNPTGFQPNVGKLVTADYSLMKNGKISVVNSIYDDEAGLKMIKRAKGKAYPVNKTNSKLKVTFFWPFKGDYWVVRMDEKNYTYTVVSDPSRKYLWILARKLPFSKATYKEITDWLTANGWDLSRLVVTGKLD